jgi:hypothetical protein
MDALSKDLRALRVSIDEVRDSGLIVRGRTGRGRTYEVKQPAQRLEAALAALDRIAARRAQSTLLDEPAWPADLVMADLWQALIALAEAGDSVLPLLEKFRPLWPEIAAGLRYCREARSDWEVAISRVLKVIEGAPLLVKSGAA